MSTAHHLERKYRSFSTARHCMKRRKETGLYGGWILKPAHKSPTANSIFKYESCGSIPTLPSHSVPRRVGECSLEFQSRKQSIAHLCSHCISQSQPRTQVLCRVRWSYLAHGNPPLCTITVYWVVGKWRCPSIWSVLVLYLHVLYSLVGKWVIGWLIAWVLRQDFTVAQVCLKSQASCLRLRSAAITDMSHKLCTLSVFFQQFIFMTT